MGRRQASGQRAPSAATFLGFAFLLASNPLTSPAELDLFNAGSDPYYALFCQVSFTVGFALMVLGAMLLGRDRPVPPPSARAVSASVAAVLLGVALYAVVAFAADMDFLLVPGSFLRGMGYAGLIVSWIEAFSETAAGSSHFLALIALLLAATALLSLGIWGVGKTVGSAGALAAVAASPVVSAALLRACRQRLAEQPRPARAQGSICMPGTTKLLIFVYGLMVGAFWAVVFLRARTELSPWSCAAFCLLGVLLATGSRTFIPRLGLEFGMALRVVTLLGFVSFLSMPLLMDALPGLAVFLLTLAWAAAILLMEVLAVRIASRLPVSLLSVTGTGGALYGAGSSAGALASALALTCLPQHLGLGAVTALVCTGLAVASLWFPSRRADASLLGIAAVPENETWAQLVERRKREVSARFGLTARESEIMGLLVDGKTRAQIAATLGTGEETVRTHTKHIYEKLGVHSLRELIAVVELDKQ